MFSKYDDLVPHSVSQSLLIAQHHHVSTRDEAHTHISYAGEKPGGSDVGNMFALKGETVIGKIGVTRSLGMQAVTAHLLLEIFNQNSAVVQTAGNMNSLSPEDQACFAIAVAQRNKDSKKFDEKWRTLLGYILGNYWRITGTQATADEKKALSERLEEAFLNYLSSEKGKALQDKIKARILEIKKFEEQNNQSPKRLSEYQLMTSKEVYALFKAMLATMPEVNGAIGYAAFSDQMCGLAQIINNQIMTATVPDMAVARHRLLVTEKEPGFHQVSTYLPNALPLQDFLLKPFLANQNEGESDEAWVARCKADLEKQLEGKSIRGFIKALLIRHIFGEVGDLGMDNMMFIPTVSGFDTVNIDLSGPRYSREKDYEDKRNKQISLGWAPTLVSTSEEEILARLFSHTVFSPRALEDSEALTALVTKGETPEKAKAHAEAMRKMIHTAIAEVLKAKVKDTALAEVAEVRDWFADLNAEALNAECAAVMTKAHGALHADIGFDSKYLEAYKVHFASFINRPHEIAKAWKAEHQPAAAPQPQV